MVLDSHERYVLRVTLKTFEQFCMSKTQVNLLSIALSLSTINALTDYKINLRFFFFLWSKK